MSSTDTSRIPVISSGIHNTNLNCWLSALLQLLFHLFVEKNNLMILFQNCFLQLKNQRSTYDSNEEFRRLFVVISIFSQIFAELSNKTTITTITDIDYGDIFHSLFPNDVLRPGLLNDPHEAFSNLLQLIDLVIDLKPNGKADFPQLIAFKLAFSFFEKTTYFGEGNVVLRTNISTETFLEVPEFIQDLTNPLSSVREIIGYMHEPVPSSPGDDMIDITDDKGVIKTKKYNQIERLPLVPDTNQSLFINLGMYRNKVFSVKGRIENIRNNKKIFINKLIIVWNEEGGKYVDKKYILNGIICYHSMHYYYVTCDKSGKPVYEYNDNKITRVDPLMYYAELCDTASILVYVPIHLSDEEENKLIADDQKDYKYLETIFSTSTGSTSTSSTSTGSTSTSTGSTSTSSTGSTSTGSTSTGSTSTGSTSTSTGSTGSTSTGSTSTGSTSTGSTDSTSTGSTSTGSTPKYSPPPPPISGKSIRRSISSVSDLSDSSGGLDFDLVMNTFNEYFYNSSTPNIQGKYIVDSVKKKHMFNLFDMEENMKEKYKQSIMSSTKKFKTSEKRNERINSDKIEETEEFYNKREQLFSNTKKPKPQKYSMNYFNDDK